MCLGRRTYFIKRRLAGSQSLPWHLSHCVGLVVLGLSAWFSLGMILVPGRRRFAFGFFFVCCSVTYEVFTEELSGAIYSASMDAHRVDLGSEEFIRGKSSW